MNWGYKIVLGFILFAAFVFTLVLKMITSGNDLVTAKYFKTGQQVNQELILHQSSGSLEKGLSISLLDAQNQTIEIQFANQPDSLTGDIDLICLSSDLADQKLPLDLEFRDGRWQQKIRLRKFQPGNWLCEIRGTSGGKEFLVKATFRI